MIGFVFIATYITAIHCLKSWAIRARMKARPDEVWQELYLGWAWLSEPGPWGRRATILKGVMMTLPLLWVCLMLREIPLG